MFPNRSQRQCACGPRRSSLYCLVNGLQASSLATLGDLQRSDLDISKYAKLFMSSSKQLTFMQLKCHSKNLVYKSTCVLTVYTGLCSELSVPKSEDTCVFNHICFWHSSGSRQKIVRSARQHQVGKGESPAGRGSELPPSCLRTLDLFPRAERPTIMACPYDRKDTSMFR